MMQSMSFENNMTKKSNLMILDDYGIDMLLFVFGFLVYWKIEPNSRALVTPEARIIAKQTKVCLFAKRSHGPITL